MNDLATSELQGKLYDKHEELFRYQKLTVKGKHPNYSHHRHQEKEIKRRTKPERNAEIIIFSFFEGYFVFALLKTTR